MERCNTPNPSETFKLCNEHERTFMLRISQASKLHMAQERLNPDSIRVFPLCDDLLNVSIIFGKGSNSERKSIQSYQYRTVAQKLGTYADRAAIKVNCIVIITKLIGIYYPIPFSFSPLLHDEFSTGNSHSS